MPPRPIPCICQNHTRAQVTQPVQHPHDPQKKKTRRRKQKITHDTNGRSTSSLAFRTTTSTCRSDNIVTAGAWPVRRTVTAVKLERERASKRQRSGTRHGWQRDWWHAVGARRRFERGGGRGGGAALVTDGRAGGGAQARGAGATRLTPWDATPHAPPLWCVRRRDTPRSGNETPRVPKLPRTRECTFTPFGRLTQ